MRNVDAGAVSLNGVVLRLTFVQGPQGVPFIASTFSHACPTRAPGDQSRMHSVFGTFFSGPVTGAEKKRQLELKEACSYASLPCYKVLTS